MKKTSNLIYATPNRVRANKNIKKVHREFYVLIYNFNNKKIEHLNIIPYLVRCYKEWADKPTSFEEFKNLIDKESKYQFWSRCEYELCITGFPHEDNPKLQKIDVYEQIKMNIDEITKILMEEINNL